MTLKKIMWLGVLPVFAMTACTSLDDNSEWRDDSRDIKFTSYIGGTAHRAAGTNWDNGDRVGIFMTNHGAGLASATASNRQYIADAQGNLTAATADDALAFPESGAAQDFVAYYPYQTVSGTTVAVNVTDQTSPAALDLLYADNAQNITSGTVNLGFDHQLAQVVLNITADATIPTTAGLSVQAANVLTQGTFDLSDGTLTATTSSTGTVTFNTNENGTQATAILLPATDASSITLRFTLDGQTVEKALTVSALEAGTSYSIPVRLGNSGGSIYVQFGSATINPWTTVTGGDIDVDFNGGTTDPDPDPQPGTETTIFEETFGDEVAKKDNGYWPSLDETDLWTSTSGLTFTDPQQLGGGFSYSNVSIRQTSTMDPHAWLPAEKESQMKIEGFNTTGCTDLTLTYDIAANASGEQSVIRLMWGDTEITVPSAAITTTNQYQTVTITGLTAGVTSLTFISEKATNTAGYRIDNIKLVGTK